MSNNEGSHLCVLCNNKLESKEALKEHFRKHANNEIDAKGHPRGKKLELPLQTPSSSQNQQGKGTYVKGSASKFVNGDIICDVCGESFKCNTLAIQHKFRKHPNSGIKHYCPQCGMQFPLKIHRDNHLDGHKIPDDQIPDIQHPCVVCDVQFYNRGAYEYHYKSVHKRIVSLFKPIVTPPPSKKIRINNAGEPQSVFYCHLCGIEYIVKFNLQKHLERQHSVDERDGKPNDLFKCTTCDALFYNEKAYKNHNMYHKPDDLYVTSEEQRLQTVRRVDQDFDIRRVQTAAEKYIPIYRCKRKVRPPANYKPVKKPKEDTSDEELSPPSGYDSSSDDSDIENNKTKNKSPTAAAPTTAASS
ncbi:uncharacterized protein LOC142323782 [Lycorma delicatula]|uniref:uncharacterized protein LOC142323782 n=1 Tax=Lycorma delicatula TaxID=130591 RepID=UPI003F514453